MTKDEALKLALKDAKRNERHHTVAETKYWCDQYKLLATQAIEALAQPEQEPVALPCCGYTDASAIKWNPYNQVVQCHNCGQVYTTPPQRTWVGLTDDEIWKNDNIMAANSGYGADFETLREVVRAIEAAHGIKENT